MWIHAKLKRVSGESFQMLNPGDSFLSTKMDCCGKVTLDHVPGLLRRVEGVAGVSHCALHCEMLL
jgi:hypothetical protein